MRHMRIIKRITASMALVAILASSILQPMTTTANVGPALDKVLLMPVVANNAPALRAIGGVCAPGTC